jgi:hypothetical protein
MVWPMHMYLLLLLPLRTGIPITICDIVFGIVGYGSTRLNYASCTIKILQPIKGEQLNVLEERHFQIMYLCKNSFANSCKLACHGTSASILAWITTVSEDICKKDRTKSALLVWMWQWQWWIIVVGMAYLLDREFPVSCWGIPCKLPSYRKPPSHTFGKDPLPKHWGR